MSKSKQLILPASGKLVHANVLLQGKGFWEKRVIWDLHGVIVDWMTPSTTSSTRSTSGTSTSPRFPLITRVTTATSTSTRQNSTKCSSSSPVCPEVATAA